MGEGDKGWWRWDDLACVECFEMMELIVVVLILFVALLQHRFGACYFVLAQAFLCFILFWSLFYELFRMQWILVNVNKENFH